MGSFVAVVSGPDIYPSAGAFSDKGNEQVRRTTLLVGSAVVVATTPLVAQPQL